MGQVHGSKRWSEGHARELLAEVGQSGESLKAYAERHGIEPQRLYSWRRKLDGVKEADSRPSREAFVPVRVAAERSATPASTFELVLAAGRVVRVGADFDAPALRRLVEALEETGR
jgi:transposase-like protein